MRPLTSDSVVSRAADLMSTRVGKEIFVLNPARDNYIGLDDIGGRIWDLIQAPMRVNDLCLQIIQEYQGDRQQIPAELLDFLNELNGEGLLELQ
jgi:hypothetical protein